jgi:hypothetical protein
MLRAKTLGPGKTQSTDVVTVSPLARSEKRPKPVTALFFRFPSPGSLHRMAGVSGGASAVFDRRWHVGVDPQRLTHPGNFQDAHHFPP